MKVEAKGQTKVRGPARFSLPLCLTVTLLALAGCGRGEEPAHSNAATPPLGSSGAVKSDAQPRIETAVVEFSPSHQALILAGKVAYGEDRYSRISSPLQGRVVEVRVRLGDRVKAGAVLLVIDSPDIAQAYTE